MARVRNGKRRREQGRGTPKGPPHPACPRSYEAANFISLIASLFVTAPPIRFTA